ncbi:MAG TPA: OmpH family outer membrane protein, partial [Tepidisphaeraceae bacterium]|nr:OmpH family outer membrane protein [Tepidisphaeraceae bacterium]
MNMPRRIALVAALVASLAAATAARAQDATRVATVNPARVFAEMQETKDLKQKLENDRKSLEQEVQARQSKVKDLQAARDLLKTDSPQYAQAEQTFMQEAFGFDTWSKVTQAQLQGQQKQQMKILFDKIIATTQQVAQQQNIDLVLADQRPDLPENLAQINVEQLRAILNGRNVIYASQKVDLTQSVIAALDANYRAGGGGAAPAPAAGGAAPAPAA